MCLECIVLLFIIDYQRLFLTDMFLVMLFSV